ncbi:dual serine/threonine and tyrosine protein kinase-like [Glandiceps talaboti]
MEDKCLTNTLHVHRDRLERLHEIVERTKGLQEDIRTSLGEGISTQLITDREEQSIRQVLEQRTVIAVIGERNSGKSSFINEFLRQKVVPTSETPCTSRVVRLKYSEDPYLRLLNVDGTEIPGSRQPLKGSKESQLNYRREVRQFAALKGDDRENEDLVSQSVEVGLNHPLLQLGIEFVDSPGRNENKTLDVVVDRLVLEKTAPIVIYIIDGKYGLRPADRANIQFFKERCPGSKLFYICSKIDRDRRASYYDENSDENSDDSDDDEAPEPSITKEERVLKELHRWGFLDTKSMESDMFYGISVKGMRTERERGNVNNIYTDVFQKFTKKLARCLDAHLKTTLSSTIGSLMRCHGKCFYCFSQKQEQLEQEEEELAKALRSARQSEEELYQELLRSVNSNKGRVQAIVTAVVQDVSTNIEYDVQHLKLERVVPYDHLLQHRDVQTKYPDLDLDEEFYKLHALCNEIRNHIINAVFRRVERDVANLLEEQVAPSWFKVIDIMEALDNETLKRNIESIYQFVGYDSDYKKDARTSLTDLMYALIRAVREDLTEHLRSIYAILPMVDVAYELYYVGGRHIPPLKEAARVLVGRLHSNQLADVIINACNNKMHTCHEQFDNSIKHIEFFKQEMRINVKEQIGATTSMIISKLAQLEIRNHALKYEIIRGTIIKKGQKLFHGQHSEIYQLKMGWGIRHPESCVIRIEKKDDAGTWGTAITNLYYAYNCKQSPHLLRIHGWLLPKPDTLYVVMERAAKSLDKDKLATTQQKLQCVIDVAKGIDCIHSCGFIFNNLEDKNILIMSDNRAVINTCKGRYEVLRGQAAKIDIRQIGELLLRFYGGNIDNTTTGSLRVNRPSTCGNDRSILKCNDSFYREFKIPSRAQPGIKVQRSFVNHLVVFTPQKF